MCECVFKLLFRRWAGIGLTTMGNCLLAGILSEPKDPPGLAGAVGSLPSAPGDAVVLVAGGLTLPIAAGLGGIAGAGLAVGGLAPTVVGPGLTFPGGGLTAGGRAPKAGRGAVSGLTAGGGRAPGFAGRAAGVAGL